MLAMLGTWELIALVVVVLLLFGHRLPGMARSLGSGITEFKRGLKDGAKPGDGSQPPTNQSTGTPPAGGTGPGGVGPGGVGPGSDGSAR